MLMTAADYRESLRAYKPRVFVNGQAVGSVADEPLLAPGINAIGVTYDFAHAPEHRPVMTARQGSSGKTVNRMAHINETPDDLLRKLEAVVPQNESYYQPDEGNSDSHLKASLVGHSVTVLIEGGRLQLGRWQGIYFCEFDGPRERRVLVKVVGFE